MDSECVRSASRKQKAKYSNVVVIGNGPAGISLSYFLSGHVPYYSGRAHTNPYLHRKLAESIDTPIIDQDIQYLSEGLEGRSSNPVALLFDNITHADADLGLESPSHVTWKLEKSRAVPHVVLGRMPPGGAWQMMEGSMQTLSLGIWMELPDMPFREWKAERPCKGGYTNVIRNRASMEDIRNYYLDFVESKGLDEYMHSYSTVTSVQRIVDIENHENDETGEIEPCGKKCKSQGGHSVWEVRGYRQMNKAVDESYEEFCYRAPRVVLATGTFDTPNRLGVPGEIFPYIKHSIAELETAINNGSLTTESDPVLIIGAGLSAADAIICAKNAGLSIVHVFRRDTKDPMMIFNKLPKLMYREYHNVHSMMKGEEVSYELYQSHPRHHIVEFKADNKVLIRGAGSSCDCILDVSYALVLTGCRPDLSFLPQEGKNLGLVPGHAIDCKHNIIDVDEWSYQSVHEPGLYAMGPLVGDNFVRFIRGGALGITSHLLGQRKAENL